MNNPFRLIISLLLVVVSFSSFAEKVDVGKAKEAASGFFKLKNRNIDIADLYAICNSGISAKDTLLYVFNLKPSGFIIISGNDNIYPVLGYSLNGNFSGKNIPSSLSYLLGYYSFEVRKAGGNLNGNAQPYRDAWLSLIKVNNATENVSLYKKDTDGNKVVGPLLLDEWDQGRFYNEMCPADTGGPGDRAVVGCVALAMAQVMHYYKYPGQGNGKHTYHSQKYGLLSANFGNTTYDWNAMPNSINESTPELAKLLFHCGVAVDMDYGPDASGTSTEYVAYALINYFKYSNTLKPVYRYNFSDEAWKSLIRGNLDSKMPVVYSGIDTAHHTGHAFVCDGYRDSAFFHINWGWGGNYNGYYYIDRLSPDGYNFSRFQFCILNIFPAKEYPQYCNSEKVFTAGRGIFDDGSGTGDYKNGSDCTWLIKPEEAASIVLRFDRFSTQKNRDSVIIYNGSTTSDSIIGVFSGNITEADPVHSKGNSMLVRFITDADSSDAGWDASYYTEPPSYCSGVKIMTMAADSFTDGSGDYNYNNRSNCKWLIKPEDADIIKLHFNSFDTEPGMDILKVVDPTKEPPQVLGYFSGNEIPPDITVNNGQMLIIFITDNANRHSGWSAEYSSSSNINEFSILNSQFSIYPNPALNNITLNLKSRILTSDSQVRFNIVNALGQTVKSLLFNSKHSATFDISDLPKGMYNVMALTGQRIINEKLIIE